MSYLNSSTCTGIAYNYRKSKSWHQVGNEAEKVTFVSNEMVDGDFLNDVTCMQPINLTKSHKNFNRCFRMDFLALYEWQGLYNNTDGVLGLSPLKQVDEKHKKRHMLWAMKNSGVI